MGGAIAVHASKPEILPTQIGLIVVDVVEGGLSLVTPLYDHKCIVQMLTR